MVALPQQYNTADLPDTGGSMPLIPPGNYQAVIVNSELKPTKNQQGHFLALTVVITQGQYANTEFVERLNIINQNQQAVEVAYKTLARISEAVGMTQTPADSNQLHNRPFFIQVETEAGTPYTDNQGQQKQGKDKSIIKKYLPMTGGSVSGSPFGNAPAAAQSAMARPPQATAAPATSPFAAPPAVQATQPAVAAPPANPFAPPR